MCTAREQYFAARHATRQAPRCASAEDAVRTRRLLKSPAGFTVKDLSN
jgi:hypothetical protein